MAIRSSLASRHDIHRRAHEIQSFHNEDPTRRKLGRTLSHHLQQIVYRFPIPGWEQQAQYAKYPAAWTSNVVFQQALDKFADDICRYVDEIRELSISRIAPPKIPTKPVRQATTNGTRRHANLSSAGHASSWCPWDFGQMEAAGNMLLFPIALACSIGFLYLAYALSFPAPINDFICSIGGAYFIPSCAERSPLQKLVDFEDTFVGMQIAATHLSDLPSDLRVAGGIFQDLVIQQGIVKPSIKKSLEEVLIKEYNMVKANQHFIHWVSGVERLVSSTIIHTHFTRGQLQQATTNAEIRDPLRYYIHEMDLELQEMMVKGELASSSLRNVMNAIHRVSALVGYKDDMSNANVGKESYWRDLFAETRAKIDDFDRRVKTCAEIHAQALLVLEVIDAYQSLLGGVRDSLMTLQNKLQSEEAESIGKRDSRVMRSHLQRIETRLEALVEANQIKKERMKRKEKNGL